MGGDAAARYRLLRIIGTREEDYLSAEPPNTMEDLEKYAEGTAAQLQALQVHVYPFRRQRKAPSEFMHAWSQVC